MFFANEMAPKKYSSLKKKNDYKETNEIKHTFEPITYEITDVATNVRLLKCAEKSVKVKALFAMAEQCTKDKLYLKEAFKCGILRNLMPFIYSVEYTTVRETLKIILSLLKLKKAFNTYSVGDWMIFIKQFSCMYLESPDKMIKEYAACILKYLTTNYILADRFIKDKVMQEMFSILANEPDADILYHTLGIIYNTMYLVMAPILVGKKAYYDFNLIVCFIRSPMPGLAVGATKLLLKMASWREPRVDARILKTVLMDKILNLIMVHNRVQQQEHLLNLLNILLESYNTAEKLIHTLEFLRFTRYVSICRPAAILPISRVFLSLSQHMNLIQQLYDFSTEDVILSLLRCKNVEVVSNVAQTISKFLQNKYCCEKLTTQTIIETFMNVCRDPTVKMIPYKNMIFKTLYEYLKRSTNAIDIIIRLNGTEIILNTFQSQIEQIKEGGCSFILDIIYIFATHSEYRRLIMNSDAYANIVDLFERNPEQILYILNQYIHYEQYQKQFVGLGGHKLIIKQLRVTENAEFFRELIAFIRNAIIYNNMVLPFLREGLMPLLKSMQKQTREEVPSIERLIVSLYNLYLPLKLHDTKRLEVTDIIANKFYLVRECIGLDFPFLDLIQSRNTCLNKIVYLIDIEKYYTKKQKSCSSDDSMSKIFYGGKHYKEMFTSTMSIKSLDIIPEDYNSEVFMASVSFDDDLSNINTCTAPFTYSAYSGLHCILKNRKYFTRTYTTGVCSKENLEKPSYDNGPCPALVMPNNPADYMVSHSNCDLISHVDELEKKIGYPLCLCISKKIEIIAEYIHKLMTLSAEDESINPNLLYELHVQFLRRTMSSSIIPLEIVSCGRHCERALLFKFLCDMLHLPATLVKGDNLIFYNEIPLIDYKVDDNVPTANSLTYYVVDLLYNVGHLMEVGSVDANQYIANNSS